jgi:hypothetical protein
MMETRHWGGVPGFHSASTFSSRSTNHLRIVVLIHRNLRLRVSSSGLPVGVSAEIPCARFHKPMHHCVHSGSRRSAALAWSG